MIEYITELQYDKIIYAKDDLNYKEFERCAFHHCDFSHCTFLALTFIDCVFNDCIFNSAKINYVALRTVNFNRCEIKDVNFAMCDKLIFEIHFTDCILDFSKFYTLKIKGTTFTNCSIIAADFMNADLTGVVFDNCDLYRAEFSKAVANKADFRTSRHFTIDPEKTKIKKALFSKENIKGLLFKHDLIIS